MRKKPLQGRLWKLFLVMLLTPGCQSAKAPAEVSLPPVVAPAPTPPPSPTPPPARVLYPPGPLGNLDELFLSTYEDRRNKLRDTVSPRVVMSGSKLFFTYKGKTVEEKVIPDTYHALKAVAHLPFAIYLWLTPYAESGGEVPVESVDRFLERIAAAAADKTAGLTAEQTTRQEVILGASENFLRGVAAAKTLSKSELVIYTRAMGPLLLANADDAGCIQVMAMAAQVEKWLQSITVDERARALFVVKGKHQARYRNAAIQYFASIVGAAVDGPAWQYVGESGRVIYAEFLGQDENSVDLLATVLLDVDASEAFFGDRWRLTEDILSRGAERCLPSSIEGALMAAARTSPTPGTSPKLEPFAVRPLSGKLEHYGRFRLECALQFAAVQSGATSELELRNSMDLHCPNEGTAKKVEGQQQNLVKNNLCATGDPKRVTVARLRQLQAAVDADPSIRYGSGFRLPQDRGPLADLGEGGVVEFIGWVDPGSDNPKRSGTRYSGSETVNCGYSASRLEEKEVISDIHLELAESRRPLEANRITAEVIPHFRMPEWTPERLIETHRLGHPVRIRGQLFFDGAHRPCVGPNDCYRASSWEIHPVYEIAVCGETSLAACRMKDATWAELEEWEE